MDLSSISDRLASTVDRLKFSQPITHVYNPLVYARRSHHEYLNRYGQGSREIILVGMNPGPWGMAQTGVPFGDIRMVRDWMGIEAPVAHPPQEHPKRPIQGFECTKSEVSGTRLWGWAKERYATPARFFARYFVHNYCPLCFMEESGKNFTPDKLPKTLSKSLFAACNEALRALVELQQPKFVVGVGAFAEGRLCEALAGLPCTIGRIPHPSPASPLANRGWAQAAEEALKATGVPV